MRDAYRLRTEPKLLLLRAPPRKVPQPAVSKSFWALRTPVQRSFEQKYARNIQYGGTFTSASP
jgi:hypothetical protein